MARWTPLLLASIVGVTGIGAFAAVRAWFVPVGSAAALPVTLSVGTQPDGAELLIDDHPRGRTPATYSIEPGVHRLAVRARGVEQSVQLTLAAGTRVTQYFDLTSTVRAIEHGRLSVITDPPGVRVAVDGEARGVSPLVIDDLAAGDHLVAVGPHGASLQRTVQVTDGVTKEVVFPLVRPTAPLAGWIVVASPFPVDVIEHGEVVGTSSTAKIMLAAGTHDVVLRNTSLAYEAARSIVVTGGRVDTVEVVAPPARLNVNARPWADVLIDGVPAGQTPLANVELPIGPHEVTFRHPQLGERMERVVITAAGVNRLSVDLGR